MYYLFFYSHSFYVGVLDYVCWFCLEIEVWFVGFYEACFAYGVRDGVPEDWGPTTIRVR